MSKVILSSIIDIISGGTPKTKIPEYWNGSIGWLSVTDFNNDLRFVYKTEKTITELGVKKSNTKYLEKGDIIISARGTVGALAQIGEPLCFNQSCFGIRGKGNIADNDYLYYALKNYVKNIKQRSQGSVFDTINLKSFNLMEIDIPKNLQTQKQIAKVLSDLDAKIEINNKINQELEAMTKTLYDYWFVQFDFPFDFAQGKPNEQGKPYKSSGGKMVFNKELKREIPEGWSVFNINEVIDVKDGTHDSPKYTKEGKYLITSKNLKIAGIDFINANHISETDFNNINNRSLVETGDILFSMIGSIGTVYKVEELIIDFAIKNVALYKTSQNEDYKNYIYMFIRSYDMLKYMASVTSGSIQKFIGLGSLRKMPIFINKKIILDFEKQTKPIFKRLKNIKLENQQLTKLRDWLLPMLMNGQVTVVEAEEQLGMVAEERAKYGG